MIFSPKAMCALPSKMINSVCKINKYKMREIGKPVHRNYLLPICLFIMFHFTGSAFSSQFV